MEKRFIGFIAVTLALGLAFVSCTIVMDGDGAAANPFKGLWNGNDLSGYRIVLLIGDTDWSATSPEGYFSAMSGAYTYSGNMVSIRGDLEGFGTVSGNTLTMDITEMGRVIFTKVTGGNPDGGTTVPGNNLVEKINWLKTNAQSGGSYTIEQGANDNTGILDISFGSRSNITITLTGAGANRTITLTSGSYIDLKSGVTLILGSNITIRGQSGGSGLIQVNGGRLRMNSGSTITGNNNRGVYVNAGEFTMSGGTISGNSGAVIGGGVFVGESCAFTMSGGTISSNRSSYGGGVEVNGTFTMTGGTISGNNATDGAGVDVGDNGTFTMNGGIISDNTASRNGGGVFIKGIFNKTGGTITGSDSVNGNSAATDGHAVYASPISSGPTRLKNTTAGPGVSLSYNGKTGNNTGAWDN